MTRVCCSAPGLHGTPPRAQHALAEPSAAAAAAPGWDCGGCISIWTLVQSCSSAPGQRGILPRCSAGPSRTGRSSSRHLAQDSWRGRRPLEHVGPVKCTPGHARAGLAAAAADTCSRSGGGGDSFGGLTGCMHVLTFTGLLRWGSCTPRQHFE